MNHALPAFGRGERLHIGATMIEALDIQVTGIVQGVGFRPFVYRTARHYLVNGWVLNAVDGVFIHAEAESKLLDGFVMELSENAPAAARVDRIKMTEVPLQDCTTFEIRFSDDADVEETTLVSPDLATCDDCARELFDPENRRYRYPFINCTNCGPRYTIIDELPYDRARTSMAAFPMCDACAAEYADVADRRFHAQPDACFDCGPQLTWSTDGAQVETATDRATSDALLARAVALLAEGGIVAVKGLGGYHLVCDATNASALAALRARKHRDGKAFAVMVPDVQAARAVCAVSAAEEALLKSPARPIVLLRKRADVALAPGLADGLPELGVMLPATPVQHLLLHDFMQAGGSSMLVMTSGNIHKEPIACNDSDAYAALAGVADGFLGNNRLVRARYDDSVVRVLSWAAADAADAADASGRREAVQFIRRARGYAPQPLEMPALDATDAAEASASENAADRVLLAVGPEQKNTFTLVRGAQAFVSQHIGDMENAETYDAWLEAKNRYQVLFDCAPTALACDDHPEYLSSKWAHEQAEQAGLPLTSVQHHHAHVASVLGEHGLQGPVCGIAFDGTGYGADGCVWGGEVLLCNQADYERFLNFAYVPMPGGAAAIKNPLRMAYGVLWAFDLLEHPAAARALAALGPAADVCDQMIDKGLNCPNTSSVGRLFDAASALCGVCEQPTYEGEAAILFDAARAMGPQTAEDDAARERYAIALVKNTALPTSTAHDTSVALFDAAPTFEALLDDLQAGVDVARIALRFHNAFVDAVVAAAEMAQAAYGITTVALTGGVFMNRYLAEQSAQELEARGFTVALNADLPPNDGCISYGQAVVACARR